MNIIGISGLHNSVAFKKREFPHLNKRQYRIAQGFDSAAALLNQDQIKAVAAEERFTREKATGAFPINAIQYCLDTAGLTPDSIDYIGHSFSYEPFESFFRNGNDMSKQFSEVYSHEAQLRCLEDHLPNYNWSDKLIQVPHHLAHASSTFYLSGFEEALVVVVDGLGEAHSMTIYIGKGNDLEPVKHFPVLHSLGLLYGVFTYYLGFYMSLDEFKVMGLAPYGNPYRYYDQMMEFIKLKDNGDFSLLLLHHNRSLEERETYSGSLKILTEKFGPPREPDSEIKQEHKDLAAALQLTLQATLLHILRHYKKETSQSNLCMAGGVALNCTANGVIKRSRLFKDMFVQPAAGDDGTALGAALYVQRMQNPDIKFKKMALPVWGPSFENEAIEAALTKYENCNYQYFNSFDDLAAEVTRYFDEGKVVGWFQGNMEFGPRALGFRSILADPRRSEMRDKINCLVKKREEFRPFAPAVTLEAASQFFEVDEGDDSLFAYMLCVAQVKEEFQAHLPAITHVDGSARVQTVSRQDSPCFWKLLSEFEKVSGLPILLNTSFNVRGQPIVCTPTEAIDTFLFAQLDALVIENYLVTPKAPN